MDTASVSAPELALRLGVSLPRIHRKLDAEGVPPAVGRGLARRIEPGVEVRLLRLMGSVPQRVAELDRVDMLVLAAVARAGLGLESARAVARVAGVSPTAASESLVLLEGRGLIQRRQRRIVQGRPRICELWVADLATEAWTLEIKKAVSQVVLPTPELPDPEDRPPLRKRIPGRFGHLFWNVDFNSLNPVEHTDFIASRMMTADDPDAWAWAIASLPPASLRKAADLRGLTLRRRALIENLVRRRMHD